MGGNRGMVSGNRGMVGGCDHFAKWVTYKTLGVIC